MKKKKNINFYQKCIFFKWNFKISPSFAFRLTLGTINSYTQDFKAKNVPNETN